MEHDTYGDEAACIIVDERGKLLLDDVYNGFDDDTLRLLDLEVKEVPEMPDPTLSVQDMKDYGYAWAGVLPVIEAFPPFSLALSSWGSPQSYRPT